MKLKEIAKLKPKQTKGVFNQTCSNRKTQWKKHVNPRIWILLLNIVLMASLSNPINSTITCPGVHQLGPWDTQTASPPDITLTGLGYDPVNPDVLFTFGFWFKLNSASPNSSFTLFEIWDTAALPILTYSLQLKTDGSSAISMEFITPVSNIAPGGAVVVNQWVYLELAFDVVSFDPVIHINLVRLNPAGNHHSFTNTLVHFNLPVVGSKIKLAPSAGGFIGKIYSYFLGLSQPQNKESNGVFSTERAKMQALYLFGRGDLGIIPNSDIRFSSYNKATLDSTPEVLFITPRTDKDIENMSLLTLKSGESYEIGEKQTLSYSSQNPVKTVSFVLKLKFQEHCSDLTTKCPFFKLEFFNEDGSQDGEILLATNNSSDIFLFKSGAGGSYEDLGKTIAKDSTSGLILYITIGFTENNTFFFHLKGDQVNLSTYSGEFNKSDCSISNQPSPTGNLSFRWSFGNLLPGSGSPFIELIPFSVAMHLNFFNDLKISDICLGTCFSFLEFSEKQHCNTCSADELGIKYEIDGAISTDCYAGPVVNPPLKKHYKFESSLSFAGFNIFRPPEQSEYLSGFDIMPCHKTCETCQMSAADNDCHSCFPNFFLDETNGTAAEFGTCVMVCHPLCSTCNDDIFGEDRCQSCNLGYHVEDGLAEGKCNEDTCHSSCVECLIPKSGRNDECTVCPLGMKIEDDGTQGKCVDDPSISIEVKNEASWRIKIIFDEEKRDTEDTYTFQIYMVNPALKITVEAQYLQPESERRILETESLFELSLLPEDKNLDSIPLKFELTQSSSSSLNLDWKVKKSFPKGNIEAILKQPSAFIVRSPDSTIIKTGQVVSRVPIEAVFPPSEMIIPGLEAKSTGKVISYSARTVTVATTILVIGSSFTSVSLIFLAKFIQFLEFISYFAFIKGSYGDQIQSFLSQIYEITNYEVFKGISRESIGRKYREGYFYRGRLTDLEIGTFLFENNSYEFFVLIVLVILGYFGMKYWKQTEKEDKVAELLDSNNIRKEGQVSGFWDRKWGAKIMSFKFHYIMIVVVDYTFFITANLSGFSRYFSQETKIGWIELVSTCSSLFLGYYLIAEIWSYFKIINSTTKSEPNKGTFHPLVIQELSSFKNKLSPNISIRIGKNHPKKTRLHKYEAMVRKIFFNDLSKQQRDKFFFCRNFNLIYILRFQVILVIIVTFQALPYAQLLLCLSISLIFCSLIFYYQIKHTFINKKLTAIAIMTSELLLCLIILCLVIVVIMNDSGALSPTKMKVLSLIVFLAFILAVASELICGVLTAFFSLTGKCRKKGQKREGLVEILNNKKSMRLDESTPKILLSSKKSRLFKKKKKRLRKPKKFKKKGSKVPSLEFSDEVKEEGKLNKKKIGKKKTNKKVHRKKRKTRNESTKKVLV